MCKHRYNTYQHGHISTGIQKKVNDLNESVSHYGLFVLLLDVIGRLCSAMVALQASSVLMFTNI